MRNSAKTGPDEAPIDPDLATIIERWSELPQPIKAGILAMISAAGDACTK